RVAVSEHAAVSDIHLDRVAVVDDGVGALVPGDLERGQLRPDDVADIDRRLLDAGRADTAGGIEIAPFRGTIGPLIAPMGIRAETRRCAERTKRKTREHFQSLATVHADLPRSTPALR